MGDEQPARHTGRGGNRGGPSKKRMAFARTAASAIREFVDPKVLADFFMAILAGKNPTIEIEDDEDGERVHVVKYPTIGIAPTLEQKMRAAQELFNRGWGQPAQMIQLEAELRGQIDHTASGINLATLPASFIHTLRDAFNARRPAGAIDTTSTERTPALPAGTDAGTTDAGTTDATPALELDDASDDTPE